MYYNEFEKAILNLINNSWRENKGNHNQEGGLEMWSFNYHKIWWTLICFEFLQELLMVWDNHNYIKHPKGYISSNLISQHLQTEVGS